MSLDIRAALCTARQCWRPCKLRVAHQLSHWIPGKAILTAVRQYPVHCVTVGHAAVGLGKIDRLLQATLRLPSPNRNRSHSRKGSSSPMIQRRGLSSRYHRRSETEKKNAILGSSFLLRTSTSVVMTPRRCASTFQTLDCLTGSKTSHRMALTAYSCLT